jgi:hypothetical protein
MYVASLFFTKLNKVQVLTFKKYRSISISVRREYIDMAVPIQAVIDCAG